MRYFFSSEYFISFECIVEINVVVVIDNEVTNKKKLLKEYKWIKYLGYIGTGIVAESVFGIENKIKNKFVNLNVGICLGF